MKHLPIVCTLVAIAAILTAPVAHAQNLVTNPGFETGSFSGWTQTLAANGTLLLISNGTFNTGSFSAGFAATEFEVDTISQAIATTPGASYTFSFFVLNSSAGNDFFSASWDGNPTVIFNNSASSLPFTQFSFNVTATSASTEIAFAGYDVPDIILLDDVSVIAVVPEAGTFTLAVPALALLGLGVLRRKRTSINAG